MKRNRCVVTLVMGLTKKQKHYLESLKERNRTIPYPDVPKIKAEDPDYGEKLQEYETQKQEHCRLRGKGLHNPMLAPERMTRRRVIRKAFNMAGELSLIYSAGVLPTREMRKDGHAPVSAAGLVEDVETAIILKEMERENQSPTEGGE